MQLDLSRRFILSLLVCQKYAYIGTATWFFLLVNIFKVPFMVHLGIINFASLRFSAKFMIFSLVGAMIAPFIVRHINQKVL